MSSIPTSPSETSLREAQRFRQALLDSDFATADEVVGCSDEEISRVSAMASFPLPDEYLAFLKILGRKAGTFFRGRNMYFPSQAEAFEVAGDIASEDGEDLSLENRFFFGHHQGYIVFFFERGHPAVYCYQEGHPDVQELGESFQVWLWQVLERSRAMREENKRRDAETEKIRERMRAEGKL